MVHDFYINVGNKLRKKRLKKGFTQTQLAEKIGYESPTAISLWEDATNRIPLAALVDIAKVLEVRIGYFLK